jgi:energy-coupling factor transporter transmembrane protein EcfT
MPPTSRRPAFVLGVGLSAIAVVAIMPAGIGGRAIPWWAWPVWALTFVGAIRLFRRAGYLLPEAMRRVAWIVPALSVFVLPAAFFAPRPVRLLVAIALLCRALATTTMGAALAAYLGPSGLARGVRQLGAPERLADVFEAMLASLTVVLRQVRAMLRAREARRPGAGAWSAVLSSPGETIRGFGRFVAALLLRALERAEAVEQTRKARGGLS